MNNKDYITLQKIISYSNIAIEFCKELDSYQAFENDLKCNMACVFALMQIGELVSNSLSEEIKNSVKTIPWKQIKGLRNRIVHGYDDVDYQTVWDTVKIDLPILVQNINSIIL